MRFPTQQAALDYLFLMQAVYEYYLLWIANAIRLSTEFGYHCSWRWGSPLSMSHTEWTHRVTRHFVYDGHKSLEHLMSHQLLKNEMDFGCAALLSPYEGVRLLSIIRAERNHLAIWPLNDPVTEEGEVFAKNHLHELNTNIDTLNHIVCRSIAQNQGDN